MISAPLFLPTQPPALPRQAEWRATFGDIWLFAENCLMQTAAALHKTHAANAGELDRGIAAARLSHAAGQPSDLLEEIARIQGHAGDQLGLAVHSLGNKVAAASGLNQPVIPFAGSLVAPSAFYESFDQLHKIARVLLSPIIFAEDADAIGTASTNPIATQILAEEIRSTVFNRFGIRPFVTTTRLDYESWVSVSRKHFEL